MHSRRTFWRGGGGNYIPEGSLAVSLPLTVTGPVFFLYTPTIAFPPFFNRTTAQDSKANFKALVDELSVKPLRLSGLAAGRTESSLFLQTLKFRL